MLDTGDNDVSYIDSDRRMVKTLESETALSSW